VVRGFLARRRVRRLARQELQTLHHQMTAKTSVPVENYRQLGVALLRSYQPQSDTELFAWFSQALVKLRQELVQLVSTNIQWRYLVSRLLKLAIDYLIDNQTSVASSLRFIQVYTDAGNYPSNGRITVTKIFKYLLTNDYFAKVRQLVDLRIPPLLEETTRPPNPVSAEILGMIVRPLAVVEQCEETGLVTEVMVQLCKHLLAPAMTDQVRLYLLPSLCESQTFPLARLLQSFSLVSQAEPDLATSPPLLFSILSLARPRLASLQPHLLSVLATLLTGVLNNTRDREETAGLEEDEDDDEEEMDDVTMRDTDSLVELSVTIINEKDFVSFFVRMAEMGLQQHSQTFSGGSSGLSSTAIRQLCVICHQLLLHHSQAMYQYSLLYTLAFTPDYLRELWKIITTTLMSLQTST